MAVIKKKEIKTLGKPEIEKRLSEIKVELAKEKASAFVGGSVKSPGKIREMRKAVARMETALKSRDAK